MHWELEPEGEPRTRNTRDMHGEIQLMRKCIGEPITSAEERRRETTGNNGRKHRVTYGGTFGGAHGIRKGTRAKYTRKTMGKRTG